MIVSYWTKQKAGQGSLPKAGAGQPSMTGVLPFSSIVALARAEQANKKARKVVTIFMVL